MAYKPKTEPIDKQITYRHMEATPAMQEYIDGQLAKVEEFLQNEPSPIYLHLVLDAEYTHHHHRVELSIKSPHYELFTDYEGPEMYDVIDRVIDTMYRLLREKKKENIDRRKEGGIKKQLKEESSEEN